MSTSRPATVKRLVESRFAHGYSSGIPIVLRSAMYASSPPRCPSSSSPRCVSEQPIIPASGTNVASRSPLASVTDTVQRYARFVAECVLFRHSGRRDHPGMDDARWVNSPEAAQPSKRVAELRGEAAGM